MNEAENNPNSDFKSVNSVNSTVAEQVLSSCILTNQTVASVAVPAFQVKQEVINCASIGSEFKASQKVLALTPSQKLELVSLIQVLRSSNTNLSEQVTQLEQALSECQAALQSSRKLEQVAQSSLTQKQKELATAQEQVKCLSEEMESSCQIAQRQQTLIETLTTELQSSQERFAQLEWENYLTQANYTEKCEQLIQTDNTCRELRTRLNRQQHYTLQLKVALEKCLEPVSSASDDANSDRIPTDANNGQTGRSIQIQSFFCNAESIPPWSAQPEFLTEIATGWVEPSTDLDFQTQNYDHSASSNWSDEDLNTSLVVETNQPITSQTAPFIDFIQQPVDMPSDRASSSQPDELLEITTDALELHSSIQDINKAKEAEEQDLLNLLKNIAEPELPIEAYQAFSASDQLDQPLNQSNLSDCHLLDPASDTVSDHKTQIQSSQPQQEPNFFTSNSNWPSPLISPSRTSKRKSLAAIELPTFTRG
ncbi:MAG: hypothetical protein KME05_06255 [Gloeocapsa sp. UFS-A4-WI-NPMV-4B04]|jgi:hypothetical protein|nr:hypothetical protein [Gloeocapsa sp. UFS-A4-WI-NPMV-4B04]